MICRFGVFAHVDIARLIDIIAMFASAPATQRIDGENRLVD
jgi:hypothetical protein